MLATHWPTSLSYMSNVNWSRTAYMDWLRYGMKYSTKNSYAVNHQSLMTQYAMLTSNPTAAIPQLVCYEGDLQTLVPTGVQTGTDPAGNYLRTALTADLYFEPTLYDWETAFYEFCQQSGISVMTSFFLSGIIGNMGGVDGSIAALWAFTNWASQPVGKGDGSVASNGLNVTNKFWANTQTSPYNSNASVRTKAWQDWANTTSPYVIPSAVSVTPANSATSVSTRVVVVVEFDEPMLSSSITSATFTLKLGTQSVTGTIAYNPVTWTATFTPLGSLKSSQVYTARLTTGVTNTNGTPLSSPVTWEFSTATSTRSGAAGWFPGLGSARARISS